MRLGGWPARTRSPHSAHRVVWVALLVLSLAAAARADVGDYVGKPIASIRVELEGREVTDPKVLQIIDMKAGTPLSMVAVRETVSRLFALGRFEDVRVRASGASAVALVFDLVPVHPVEKIDFTVSPGAPDVDTGRLRREVVERYGASPPVGRAPELVRVIEDDLHTEGYFHPTVASRAELRHDPDRAMLIFTIDPGPRSHIADVAITGTSGLSEPELLRMLGLVAGAPYRSEEIASRIVRYVDNRRSRGYFSATLTPEARFGDDDSTVHLTLTAAQGPHVRVLFDGDPLPADRRADLVPIEREGSADEDLLEDSTNRIEDYLRGQGYRDAAAPHARVERDGELVITFSVKKGPLYRIASVELSGANAFPAASLAPGLRVREAQPFSSARLDADATTIEDFYRRQGFAAVVVQADEESAPHEAGAVEVPVKVRIDITENVRTVVSSVRVEGNLTVPEAGLRSAVGLQPGHPFFLAQMALDREGIQQQYANLGFQSAMVDTNPGLSADHARADVVFTVHEGPRVLVDHVLIVGNVRTKTETIERELQFKPGDPLSPAAVSESQRRLANLGLFRRIDITAIGHSEDSRDVLISVEESPVTTVSYGGGVGVNEFTETGAGGAAEQRIEFAPRAFFEIGRRNLFGTNRSVNLFTSVSLYPKNSDFFSPADPNQPAQQSSSAFGFPEYRVLGTFRQPHVFGTLADADVTATLQQQIRPNFDFSQHALTVEAGRRVTRYISLNGNYQIQTVKLFSDNTPPNQQLLVDRLFPQLRLSSFLVSAVRSTKDDALDPTTGTYLSASAQLAARAIGSDIGLVKSYMRAQWFHTLAGAHRTVLATNATLGLAQGLPRDAVQADGSVVSVTDLPASERFFAGGDTTVRGFALDSLGAPNTIDASGFAQGGNAVLILNAELRVPYRSFQFVGFFDTGNVFARRADIDLGELRSAVGVGIRYKSPIGPIRVDLGFKVHRESPGGVLEPLTALHISLGQAF